MAVNISTLINELGRLPVHRVFGRVSAVQGLLIEVSGVQGNLSVGDRCNIIARDDRRVTCEVVGFRDGRALLMPFGVLEGVGLGCRAEIGESQPAIFPEDAWLGRVINAMGRPIDEKGALPSGDVPYPIKNTPPPAHTRKRIGSKVDLGPGKAGMTSAGISEVKGAMVKLN